MGRLVTNTVGALFIKILDGQVTDTVGGLLANTLGGLATNTVGEMLTTQFGLFTNIIVWAGNQHSGRALAQHTGWVAEPPLCGGSLTTQCVGCSTTLLDGLATDTVGGLVANTLGGLATNTVGGLLTNTLGGLATNTVGRWTTSAHWLCGRPIWWMNERQTKCLSGDQCSGRAVYKSRRRRAIRQSEPATENRLCADLCRRSKVTLMLSRVCSSPTAEFLSGEQTSISHHLTRSPTCSPTSKPANSLLYTQ